MLFRDLWLPTSALVLLIGILSGQGLVTAVGLLLLTAGGVSRWWGRHCLDRVRYERVFPETRAFVGEKLACTLRVTNGKWLPLPWLEVQERIPEALPPEETKLEPSSVPQTGYVTRATSVSQHERVNWRYNLLCTARGYYSVGPTRLRSSDLFGFFPREMYEAVVTHLVVYPRTVPLSEMGLPSQRPLGERKGRERIFEDPLRVIGVRDYQPGDPLRRIDWKATARRGQLQSRVYEPSTVLHLVVALNINTLGHTWEGYDPVMLERGVIAAASIARYANESRYAVGLLANGSIIDADRPIKVPVGRHPDQLSRILEALAMVQPYTITSLEGLLEQESHAFPLGATLVLVTGLLPESLAATVLRLRDDGHPAAVVWTADTPPPHLPNIPVYPAGQYLQRWDRVLIDG